MSRHNQVPTRLSSSTVASDEPIPDLPDLSAFEDDEKQHILDVLIRDEHLRNRHLARFMYVRSDTEWKRKHWKYDAF